MSAYGNVVTVPRYQAEPACQTRHRTGHSSPPPTTNLLRLPLRHACLRTASYSVPLANVDRPWRIRSCSRAGLRRPRVRVRSTGCASTLERTQDSMATEFAALAMEAWAKRRMRTFQDAERGLVFGRLTLDARRGRSTSAGAGCTTTSTRCSSSTGRRRRRGRSTRRRRRTRTASRSGAATAPTGGASSTSPTSRSTAARSRAPPSRTSCSRSSSAAATGGCATSSRRSSPTSTG